MAAWFLIARFLLLYVLSDVDYSAAFPGATSPVQPGAWQGGRGEHNVYGNPRPFQYMRALRPADPKIYPNVRHQVQVQSPRSYQPRSNIPSHRPMETYPLQPRAHRDHLVAKPRSFDLSLKIPYARYGTNPPRYGPSGLIIDNSFNKPGRLNDPSKLGYQFSLAVPFSRGSPRRQEHHGRHRHRPEEDDSGHRRPLVYVPSHTRPHPDEHHRDEGHPGWDSAFLEPDGLERPSRPRPDEHHRDEGRPGRDSAFLEPDGLERPSRPRPDEHHRDEGRPGRDSAFLEPDGLERPSRPRPDEHHRDEGRPGRDSAFLEPDGLERPSRPRPDKHHRDEGRPGRDSAFLEPDGLERPSRPRHPQRYVHPYSGYYNSHMNPMWNDYWWYYHGPHWGQVKQQSSDPWPNFHRSASD